MPGRTGNYNLAIPLGCTVTANYVQTSDNFTYTYEQSNCWTLTSAHCSPKPMYAVFTKKASAMPLAMKVYLGGHTIDMNPIGQGNIDVKLNGHPLSLGYMERYNHKVNGEDIFT